MEYLIEPVVSSETGVTVMNLAIVFILVLANAFFVASEFALVSVRKTRIDQLAAEGNSAAAVVQRAVRDLDRYIAATQVGITIASLLLGGRGERALEPLLTFLFIWMPDAWLGITRTGLVAGFVYFIMTVLHVIIGELMPHSVWGIRVGRQGTQLRCILGIMLIGVRRQWITCHRI